MVFAIIICDNKIFSTDELSNNSNKIVKANANDTFNRYH